MTVLILVFLIGMFLGDYLRPARLENKERMGKLGKKLALIIFNK